MNPENNNPLANPGVPDFGVPNSQLNIPGNSLSLSDNLSMAGDSLAAAGMAAGSSSTMPTSDANSSFASIETPLVPADPVPGSIGSVTSVPAAEPLANPFAPTDDTMPSGAMPAPEVQPQAAPYNPFDTATEPAAPVASAPEPSPIKPFTAPSPAPEPVKPAFQPAPALSDSKKKTHSISPLTAILAVACALLLVTTIIFIALYINAKNTPKIVYVPTVSEGESNSQISLLACSRSEEANWLANDAYAVPAVRTLTMNYSNNKINAILDEYQATLATEEDAILARNIFNSLNAELATTADIDAVVLGNVLETSIGLEGNSLNTNVALNYLYGSTIDVPTTSMDDVRSVYEAEGYICTIE